MELLQLMEQESKLEVKKSRKYCSCFKVSDMKIWLGSGILLFMVTVLLLTFKGFEGSLLQSYVDFIHKDSDQQSSLLLFMNKSSEEVLLVGLENSREMEIPSSHQFEIPRDSHLIETVLSHVNSSTTDSSILSVWKYMAPVLSRPDCFPEANQGMKEAEDYWKEFITKHKHSENLLRGKSKTNEKRCPYSVNSGNLSFVEIPCGLVVDSSITFVAIPSGNDFQVELVGPKSPGETDPVIILHISVRLLGDTITENAVIVQNTWTRKDDWGNEERCPGLGQSSRKVDGLEMCSKEVGKSAVRILSDNSSNVLWSNEIALTDKKPWFPFTNGFPLAATLWVGWQGFHITVNGKHVTSFEYRQNLKPSLANAVRLKGSIKPISVLLTGLPTSEDATYTDLQFLKAPPLKRGVMNRLFIGVFSTGNNFDRRMAIRRTWMQYEAVRAGDVTVRFFVGQHSNKQVNKEIWKEAHTYGDIQLMPYVDYYNLITLKTIAICIFGTQHVKSKYIMKTDDDTFVRVDEILTNLGNLEENKGLLYGLIESDSKPNRDPTDKWYITNEEYSGSSYPPWAHGPGYIISRDVANFIAKNADSAELKLFKLEDVSMGMWIEEYKKKNHTVYYLNDGKFHNLGCSDGFVIAHYQNPKHMACLWQKLREGLGPTCCNES